MDGHVTRFIEPPREGENGNMLFALLIALIFLVGVCVKCWPKKPNTVSVETQIELCRTPQYALMKLKKLRQLCGDRGLSEGGSYPDLVMRLAADDVEIITPATREQVEEFVHLDVLMRRFERQNTWAVEARLRELRITKVKED